MGAWTPEAEPVSTGGSTLTPVEGSSFCRSRTARRALRIDGKAPEPVAIDADFAVHVEVKEGRVQARRERRVQWQAERGTRRPSRTGSSRCVP